MEPPDEHPLDGVWVPLDPESPDLARRLNEAARMGATGAVLPWEGPRAPTVPEHQHLPLRVDLGGAPLRDGGPAIFAEAADLQADLLGLSVRSGDEALLREGLLTASRLDLEVVLSVTDAVEASLAVTLAHESEQVVGFRVAGFDEEALDQLSCREDLGLLCSGPEFASAFRRGAGGLEGFPASLSPAVGRWLLDLCHREVDVALELERRLLRFFEGHLRPAARRLTEPGEDPRARELALHGAVGGWAELGSDGSAGKVDPNSLRATLLEQVPELTALLP